jgi:ADP-heptose:LPS heptosyltransferase
MSVGPSTIDLDELTRFARPTESRTDEFADALGVSNVEHRPITLPSDWLREWDHLHGAILFAPEAAHESRRCPDPLAIAIGTDLTQQKLVIVGNLATPEVPCHTDLRGKTGLRDLLALVRHAAAVICMDSAMLHIATLLGTPAVAIFGGIDPHMRTHPWQRVTVLVGNVSCRPCNKRETCNGAFYCLQRIGARDVVQAVRDLDQLRERAIRVI